MGHRIGAMLRWLPVLGLLFLHYAFADQPEELRIGYQKGSIALVLAKEHRLLEQAFPATQVRWIEFPAGPQMLEALNVGALDIGATGDLPPLFAQAAGADLLYIGAEPPKPQAETILVQTDSPLQSVADLKGKKVAFQKGSSAHNLILRALNKAGLGYADIHPVYLSPADARAAFEQGSVDAWVIWEPFSSLAILKSHARLLADGRGLDLSGPIYSARRSFAKEYPDLIRRLPAKLTAAEALIRTDRQQSLAILTENLGLPKEVVARHINGLPPSPISPISPQIIAAQQRTADLFHRNRLLPKALDVRQVAP